MKIHYYEYSDDGVEWCNGAASFYSMEVLQLAEQQPYKYRICTVEFDPSRISKRWNEEKIKNNLEELKVTQEIFNKLKNNEQP